MKKLLLILCFIACIFTVTGCGQTDTQTTEYDDTLKQFVERYLETFRKLNDETLQAYIDSTDPSQLATNGDAQLGAAIQQGLVAWSGAKDELGEYVDVKSFSSSKVDDGVKATLLVQFEKRDATFAITLTEDYKSIVSFQIDAIYSMSEKIEKALLNTVMSMSLVFIILIFISFVIEGLKYIPSLQKKFSKKAKVQDKTADENASLLVDSIEDEVLEDLTDDLELVAVISAAIAASENRVSTDGLVVRSIKRAGSSKWKRA